MTTLVAPPGLDEALASQQDLEALCADRPLRTNEIFEPNAYYGCDAVVRRWAGVAADRPLKLALAHGVAFKMLFYDRRERVPVLTYQWDVHRDALVRRGISGRLWPLSSPFVLAGELLTRELLAGPAPERHGTIAFVARLGGDAHAARQRAEELAALPNRYGPVRACLRWQDVLRGRHRPFLEAGVEVLSAGHSYDPVFLFRLHHLCSIHERIVTNGMGSHIFYAVWAGCRYEAVLEGSPATNQPSSQLTSAEDAVLQITAADVVDRLDGRSQVDQRELIGPLLGAEHLAPGDRVAAAIRRAEVLDLVAVHRPRVGLAVPDALRRTVRSVVRR